MAWPAVCKVYNFVGKGAAWLFLLSFIFTANSFAATTIDIAPPSLRAEIGWGDSRDDRLYLFSIKHVRGEIEESSFPPSRNFYQDKLRTLHGFEIFFGDVFLIQYAGMVFKVQGITKNKTRITNLTQAQTENGDAVLKTELEKLSNSIQSSALPAIGKMEIDQSEFSIRTNSEAFEEIMMTANSQVVPYSVIDILNRVIVSSEPMSRSTFTIDNTPREYKQLMGPAKILTAGVIGWQLIKATTGIDLFDANYGLFTTPAIMLGLSGAVISGKLHSKVHTDDMVAIEKWLTRFFERVDAAELSPVERIEFLKEYFTQDFIVKNLVAMNGDQLGRLVKRVPGMMDAFIAMAADSDISLAREVFIRKRALFNQRADYWMKHLQSLPERERPISIARLKVLKSERTGLRSRAHSAFYDCWNVISHLTGKIASRSPAR